MNKPLVQRSAGDVYAQACRADIERWLAAPPDWGTRLMAGPGKVAATAARQLVPVSLLRGSLSALERAAGRIADSRSVMRWAGVSNLHELAHWPLQSCDDLARKVERRAMALGGTSGAALGFGGVAGLVADVPTLLTLALRTIHRTAFCYGEDWQDEGASQPCDRCVRLGLGQQSRREAGGLGGLAGG